MDHVVGCLFTAMLVAGAWASIDALAPLFARLPYPGWLLLYMISAIGFFSSLLALFFVIDLLQHGFRWREIAHEGGSPRVLLVWLVTLGACGAACGTYGLLAPRHLPLWQEQLGAGVAGVGVWFLLMIPLERRAHRRVEAILADCFIANRQSRD